MPIPLILGMVCGIALIGTIKMHLDGMYTPAYVMAAAGGFNLALFLHSLGI